jgi:hypothetical protein
MTRAVHTKVETALDDLLQRQRLNEPVARAEVDQVLTDGYAEALDLEVRRLEVARRLRELGDASEAEELAPALDAFTTQLMLLRQRLAEASRRFGRNPLSDD